MVSLKNIGVWTAAAAVIAVGSVAAGPSIHEAVTANPSDWVCTKETVRLNPSVANVDTVSEAYLADQCILQLAAEFNLDANQITLDEATKYREYLDAEEHAWMQNYANKHGIEIIYNKYNSEDDISAEYLAQKRFVSGPNISHSEGQYFIASRAWQAYLNTIPFRRPATDMMVDLGAAHRDHLFTKEKYTLTSEERAQLSAETLEQKLVDDAHNLVEKTKPVFNPADIWVKDGKTWYKAYKENDMLVLDPEQKTIMLEMPYEAKYHVTPAGE